MYCAPRWAMSGPLRSTIPNACNSIRCMGGRRAWKVRYCCWGWWWFISHRSSSACGRITTMSSARVPITCTIAPWLTVRNGEQALRFYQEAFGATVVYRLKDPAAGVVARLSVEGAEFWLSDGQPDESSPESLGGGSVRMILTVADPDT